LAEAEGSRRRSSCRRQLLGAKHKGRRQHGLSTSRRKMGRNFPSLAMRRPTTSMTSATGTPERRAFSCGTSDARDEHANLNIYKRPPVPPVPPEPGLGSRDRQRGGEVARATPDAPEPLPVCCQLRAPLAPFRVLGGPLTMARVRCRFPLKRRGLPVSDRSRRRLSRNRLERFPS
jgi:hypothetical protein